MKKLFTLFSCVTISIASFAQSFKEGNLIVMRYGDGATTLNYQPVPVFFDEYTVSKSIAPVKTVAVPTSNVGANFKLTGVPKYGNNVTQEGLITLSTDQKYITFCGYVADPGASVKESNRVIGKMDAYGKFNTSTTLAASDIAQIRCAVADGNNFWITGAGSGIRYATLGGTNATLISNQSPSNRSLAVFNNQLYGSTSGSPARVFTVGTGLPTNEGTKLTYFPTSGTSVATNQFLLLDADPAIAGADLLYIVNDGATADQSALQKFAFDGSKWNDKGSVSIAGTTDNLKSLTGNIVSGSVFIYAVTAGNEAASPSALLKFTDQKAIKSTLDSKTNAPEVLATAPSNTMFRSLVFSPVK